MPANRNDDAQQDFSKTPWSRFSKNAAFVWLVLFALGLANWAALCPSYTGPVLRLTPPRWNDYAFCLVLCCPWLAIMLLASSCFKRELIRYALITVLAIISIVSIPVGLLTLFWDTDDDVIATVPLRGYQVALHRLNCGAPCSFMLTVDQERMLGQHVMLTRQLALFDPAAEARIEVIGQNEVRVTPLPYDDRHKEDTNPRTFLMKPYFWF